MHPYRNTEESPSDKITLPSDNNYVTFHYLDENNEKKESYKKFEPTGYWSNARKAAQVTSGSFRAICFVEGGFGKGFFLLQDWYNSEIEITIPANRILSIVHRKESCTITIDKSND